MRTFDIPVSFTIDTSFEVTAPTLEAAIRAAQEKFFATRFNDLLEHIQPEQVNKHSVKIDKALAEEMNPKRTYTVKLVRTLETIVEVEADDENDASDAAIALHENGNVPECEWEETDLETDDIECEEVC